MTREPAGPVGFDLDLTLIDSQPAIMAAWRELARETGARIDLDSITTRMGIKLEDEVARWFASVTATRPRPATAGITCGSPRISTTPLPGAAEALAAVRRAGERVIIVTAKHPVSVGPSLVARGWRPTTCTAHVYGPEKAAVLSEVGAAVYVGDAPADMGAAIAADTHAVGVTTGSFSAADLLAAGAAAGPGLAAGVPVLVCRPPHRLGGPILTGRSPKWPWGPGRAAGHAGVTVTAEPRRGSAAMTAQAPMRHHPLPHPALPHPALPRPALPHPALPRPALPRPG